MPIIGQDVKWYRRAPGAVERWEALEPRSYGPVEGQFGWWRYRDSQDDGLPCALLPEVFDLLPGEAFARNPGWKWYATREEALEALGVAIARKGDR